MHLQAEEDSAPIEVLAQWLVGGFEEHPAHQRHGLLEGTIGANRVDQRQPVTAAGL